MVSTGLIGENSTLLNNVVRANCPKLVLVRTSEEQHFTLPIPLELDLIAIIDEDAVYQCYPTPMGCAIDAKTVIYVRKDFGEQWNARHLLEPWLTNLIFNAQAFTAQR